jgi:hypothetical protein
MPPPSRPLDRALATGRPTISPSISG